MAIEAKVADRKKLIFLVDDDKLILDLLSLSLSTAGYDVFAAESARAAVDKLAELDHEPDLAILDVSMPGMSGLELAKWLREETTVSLMFFSGSEDREIVKQATEYGAVGYLVKPIDPAQILPAVQAGLARAEDIKRLRQKEANLTLALASGRETSMAVGLLMERYKIDRDAAFDRLRDYARSNRVKIHDVANHLLNAAECLNKFNAPPPAADRASQSLTK
jgi:response regulator NasT